MSKKAIFAALIAGIIVIFSSCSSTPFYKYSAESNIPLKQRVRVTFVNNLTNGSFILKEWNGYQIQKEIYGKNSWSPRDKVQLSVNSGLNVFTFDIRYEEDTRYVKNTHKIDNYELKVELDPKRKYRISGKAKKMGKSKGFGSNEDIDFYINLYDITKGSTLVKEIKIGSSKY